MTDLTFQIGTNGNGFTVTGVGEGAQGVHILGKTVSEALEALADSLAWLEPEPTCTCGQQPHRLVCDIVAKRMLDEPETYQAPGAQTRLAGPPQRVCHHPRAVTYPPVTYGASPVILCPDCGRYL